MCLANSEFASCLLFIQHLIGDGCIMLTPSSTNIFFAAKVMNVFFANYELVSCLLFIQHLIGDGYVVPTPSTRVFFAAEGMNVFS